MIRIAFLAVLAISSPRRLFRYVQNHWDMAYRAIESSFVLTLPSDARPRGRSS